MNRQLHSATILLFIGCGVVSNPRGFSPGEDVNNETLTDRIPKLNSPVIEILVMMLRKAPKKSDRLKIYLSSSTTLVWIDAAIDKFERKWDTLELVDLRRTTRKLRLRNLKMSPPLFWLILGFIFIAPSIASYESRIQ